MYVTGQSRGGKGLKNNGPLLMLTNTVESNFLKCSIYGEVRSLKHFLELVQ